MRALAAVGAAVGDCAIEPQPELRLKELLRRAAILIKADESELVEGGPCRQRQSGRADGSVAAAGRRDGRGAQSPVAL